MVYVKRIVCLAKSFKTGGSCIAGRELLRDGQFGGWIRPVSARASAEISSSESMYHNYASPRLLDVIDVQFFGPVPHGHQTENHQIDPTTRWVKQGEFPMSELDKLCEQPTTLWINSDRTSNGYFDCISQEESATLGSSLMLIKKQDFAVEVGISPWNGRKTFRGNFSHNDVEYSLRLTDPNATRAFESKDQGEYRIRNVYLCISLTEPFEKDKRCHKLVASVITSPAL
jgi:hypothetical protein